jgi:hypothetical protein
MGKSLFSARNVVKRVGPQGGFRSLSYEYTVEGGHTLRGGTSLAADAGKLEAFFSQHEIPITVEREEKQKHDAGSWTTKPPYWK